MGSTINIEAIVEVTKNIMKEKCEIIPMFLFFKDGLIQASTFLTDFNPINKEGHYKMVATKAAFYEPDLVVYTSEGWVKIAKTSDIDPLNLPIPSECADKEEHLLIFILREEKKDCELISVPIHRIKGLILYGKEMRMKDSIGGTMINTICYGLKNRAALRERIRQNFPKFYKELCISSDHPEWL